MIQADSRSKCEPLFLLLRKGLENCQNSFVNTGALMLKVKCL